MREGGGSAEAEALALLESSAGLLDHAFAHGLSVPFALWVCLAPPTCPLLP